MKTLTNITYSASALFAFACFVLLPRAYAVCQEGCDLVSQNTFLGEDALINNTSGGVNTAIGYQTLFSNTTGFSDTAIGFAALYGNTTGYQNTAMGLSALSGNTTGSDNTATGATALLSNTIGLQNTANGSGALANNTTGNFNTATGAIALYFNSSGNENTANGTGALYTNSTGSNNTATGYHALFNNATGSNNIALGFNAGSALTTGSHNIDIGNAGRVGESNYIRIGAPTHTHTFIAGVSGAIVAGGVGVIIDTNGHLGTVVSSARFKDAIKPMDKTSEAILSLQPVTFHYKHELDPEGIPQFGLVAEDVEKVNPDLIARDEQGKPYTVRYEAVNAMLLNEFLKAHRKLEEQGTMIARQQKQIEALTAGLRKVSAQLELDKAMPQITATNQ